ncbi:MAG: C4-type zinc ribbon domain-containing protein [Muribaculum sp.]|nr:C4-type zinc ribbon domain-containing protein [Muribaculum sp.]
MATEKKTDKELSVEERLKALYQLQTLLSEIDRIKFLRGELPNEVKDLEDDIVRYQTRIQKYTDEISDLKEFVSVKKEQIEERKAKIAKYEDQINHVRNNREYAFLEKEKEFESLEIELAEKNIREALEKQEAKQLNIDRTREELSDHEHILEEKKSELAEIVSETRQEEENIRTQAKALEPLIDDYTLAAFKRIRKNAHNGLGIVTVQRNACGGCFNRIPPQRQLEIKMHKKVIVCEYCGRIMIDAALAGIEEPTQEEPQKKTPRKRSSKTAE